MIAIARAGRYGLQDTYSGREPTSSLDEDEMQKLVGPHAPTKSPGCRDYLHYPFYRMWVYEISDRITVLRNGKLIGGNTTPQRFPKLSWSQR